MTIRFATPDDFISVRKFDPHSKFIDPERIKYKLQAQEIIIALEENKIVGLIKFSYIWATRPYLELIWVSKTHRSQGLGFKLLKFLEKYLVEAGYTYLFTSSEEDEKAPQEWHKRQGFSECGSLSMLNAPFDSAPEVFFFKRLVDSDPEEDKLKQYPVV